MKLAYRLTAIVFACCVSFSENSARSQTPAAAPLDRNTTETLWYGDLDAGQRLLRFLVKVRTNQLGMVFAKLLSLDEGNTEFALDEFTMANMACSFELKATKASFSGRINPASDLIEGRWIQRGATLPLSFRKVESLPKEEAKEIWLGTLNAGIQKLVMQFRIYEAPDGTQHAFVDSVSQKAGGFKANVKMDAKRVSVNSEALQFHYEGERSADGSTLEGQWKQGATLGLTMKRTETPADATLVALNRPQTPKAPYPYESKTATFTNATAGVELSGTLCYPKSTKPVAVAILISGSGPHDRDETMLDHKPFAVLADYLAKNGIATLRYDDRGVGQSTGTFAQATTADFASDVEAAIDFLRTESNIDPSQIGLIGHSEGGLIAPMVAATRPEVAWVVLMAAPGVNGEQILISQGQLIIAANGGDEKVLRTQKSIQQVAFDSVKNLVPGEELSRVVESCTEIVLAEIDKAGDAPVKAELADFKMSMTEMMRDVLTTVNSPWMRYFLRHEPGPALEQTKCPVLAVNGKKDLQVDPKLNLAKIASALKTGGNQDFEIQELSGLNHLFQECVTGSPNEYASIDETLSPRFLEAVGQWIKARVK